MRHAGTLVTRLSLICLSMAVLVFGQTQHQRATSQSTSTNPVNAAPPNKKEKRKGRNLLEKMPTEVEGVTLEEGFIKLREGYRFQKEKNGVVSVYLKKTGGSSVAGSWSCSCTHSSTAANANCSAEISGSSVTCASSGSCTKCELVVTVNRQTTAVVGY